MATAEDIVVIEIQERGLAGGGFTDAEFTQMRTDMDTMLSRPAITSLDAVPGVSAGAPADGQALVWNQAANGGLGEWWAMLPVGALTWVRDGLGNEVLEADRISLINGLQVSQIAANVATIEPTYAGSGSAVTVSRSDHTHNPPIIPDPQTFAATGSLSSGTRTLLTYNAGPLLDGVTYDCKARVVVALRNDINAGVVLLGLKIGAHASFPRTTNPARNVGGVDVPHDHVFRRTNANGGAIVGTGATVAVVADITYDSGDPTNVRHGWIEFEAHPRG